MRFARACVYGVGRVPCVLHVACCVYARRRFLNALHRLLPVSFDRGAVSRKVLARSHRPGDCSIVAHKVLCQIFNFFFLFFFPSEGRVGGSVGPGAPGETRRDETPHARCLSEGLGRPERWSAKRRAWACRTPYRGRPSPPGLGPSAVAARSGSGLGLDPGSGSWSALGGGRWTWAAAPEDTSAPRRWRESSVVCDCLRRAGAAG